MRLQRLNECYETYFSAAFSLCESAFPREERRDRLEQERVLKHEDYHFDLIIENGVLLGVMLYWEIGSMIFLEHFATMPHIRGNGIGTKALELLKAKGKTVFLEIEPPQDAMTIRRYGFYQRSGFVMNPFHHIQAKYHWDDKDLELKILSFPRILTDAQYRDFHKFMIRNIAIRPKD